MLFLVLYFHGDSSVSLLLNVWIYVFNLVQKDKPFIFLKLDSKIHNEQLFQIFPTGLEPTST